MQKARREYKSAAIIYSGGKDSHLVLYKALKSGYKIPFLVTFDGGRNHFKTFNDCLKSEIIKEHAAMIGSDLFVYKINSEKFTFENVADVFMGISKFAISRHYFISEIFSSFDLHGRKENNALLKNISFFSSIMDFRINFSHGENDVIDVLSELRKYKIKIVIVSAEEKIDKKYLGKEVDIAFMKYIKKERLGGNFISGNDFQTFVVESPLFDKKMKILEADIFKSGKTNFLDIKKYEFK